MNHVPVLEKEVLSVLHPRTNENFIDATVGFAGHTQKILEQTSPDGMVLGIEWDDEVYQILLEKIESELKRFKKRLVLVNESFANLKEVVKKLHFKNPKGILFDLGMSSWHIEQSGRGFTFQKEEILDMRFNKKKQNLTAMEIVNSWPRKDLEKIFRDYANEKFAKKIAQEIVAERKRLSIKTTFQLVGIIKKATPSFYHHRRIHFATKTFQALRIAVNNEIENLKKGLSGAAEILPEKGKIAVIAFHSLEDRTVKHFFKEMEKRKKLKILTKKPITPSLEEVRKNPRARSAKLRVAQILKVSP